MRKNLLSEIELPESIVGLIKEGFIIMRKGQEEQKRKLNNLMEIKIEGNKIILKVDKSTKRERKIFGTFEAHIKNMIKGLNEKFKYRLQIVSVHFPITVSIDKAKNEFNVKNFIGEKVDRKIKLLPDVEVKVNKDIIEVESSNKESAGQVAANLEKGTKIRNRDRRIFQDGIFIIEKPGRQFI
jgi:large subunit ribosomal protein L6